MAAVLLGAWVLHETVRYYDPARVAAREQLAARKIPPDPLSLYVRANINDLEAVRLLLDAGLSPNRARDHRGRSALMAAVSNANLEAVDLLLKRGADPNQITNEGFTALYIASMKGYPEIVHGLLTAGADPNVGDVNGSTPLLAAVSLECWDWGLRAGARRTVIVRDLLAAGARVNVSDSSGTTVLAEAERCYPQLLPALRAAALKATS